MSKELDLGRVVGKDATINGQNAIQLIAGKDINISQEGGNVTVSVSDDLNAVPKERMINNKPLSEDITLNASDVGAVPTSRTINGKSLTGNISLTSEDTGSVPVGRTVNGKPLSENISLSATDVGAAAASHGTHVTYGTTSPKMDGTAAVGRDSKLARADHVHPSDTSKQDKLTGTPDQYVTFDENGNAIAKQKDYSLFGFQIDNNESDPSKIIKYIAQNASYDPAFMDYEKDEFNYGDWGDAWFIKNIKVVDMKLDGTVIHEINKNNYEDEFYDGGGSYNEINVMVGIPTVWVKYVKVNNKDTFYFSDIKVNDDFHAYAHIAADGSIMPYTYLAAYNGWKTGSKLRSLNNCFPTCSMSGTDQITAARANNPTGKHMWDIDTLADRNLINLLLLLIGKSTDTQTTFGNGNTSGSNSSLQSGTMNNKGLFWGSNADNLGVKVFGIENWWGNVQRRTQGLILDEGVYKIKLTYGTEDGSIVEGYNTTGEGYINTNDISPSDDGFINSMYIIHGILLPKSTNGSKTTYYCDMANSIRTGKYFSCLGGATQYGGEGNYYCGAFDSNFKTPVGSSGSHIGSCLSCKPY